MENQEVRIDLAKGIFNFSEISNKNQIKEIRFDNYTEKIEIPLTINDYPNITKLSFYGQSREDLFETPDHLEQFIHIKHLLLWSYCDFTKIKPMTQIEELSTVVKNTEADSKQIVTLFPNLKNLEIWGGHLKKEELSKEIGNLNTLESLHLVSCGLRSLPDTLGNLKNLKELNLRGLPITSFPEVITQLEHLETLEIRATLPKLPDTLSNLKSLKKLNLYSSLNEGRMEITGKKEEKLYLRPIPEAIGKLENLEELNLGICGVYDITPLISLKKLKKLDLQYSALKSCEGFSNFTALEDLNLETSYDLKNLEGLTGMNLKSLNLSSNYSKLDISVISSLEALETLDIESCNRIKDFNPIYNHPNLKELKADYDIIKNWKKKDLFKTLPSVETLIAQLETEDVLKFEETISNLAKHVKANHTDDENPLAGYFDVETEDEEITEIEILDNAIQKHIKNLSEKALITIFKMTFKSVGYDNFNATLLVLEEVIERKNTDTQKKIIKKFYSACEYYDAGHRFWGCTVHDQLIDDLFSRFTSDALYQLLKKASTDMLSSESGDAMDTLFVPAFKNTTNEKLHKKLLNVFFNYEEEARTYFGKEYFDSLLHEIKEIATPELEKIITAKKEENKEQEELIQLLEELKEENLSEIVEMLGNKIPKKLEEEYLSEIVTACQKENSDEKTVNQLINFLIKEEETSYLAKLLQAKYHKTNPEKIISILNQLVTDKLFDKNETYNIARLIISDLVPNEDVVFNDLEIYRNFSVSKCNIAIDTIYNSEIQRLLSRFFNSISNSPFEEYIYLLEKAKEIFSKTETQFSYSSLHCDVYYLVSDGENEKCRIVFNYLCPTIKNYSSENILYINAIAAIKLNDSVYFDSVLKEIQKLERITQVLLAFNLACGFAHFERKDEMLFHIKESIRLGKTKQQFLDDTDFEKYWNDEDFLTVINE